MNNLPKDLLALVLTFLHFKERSKRTDLVCKAFNQASKYPICWDFAIALNNDNSITKAVTFFTKHHIAPQLVVEEQSSQISSRVLLHTLSLFTDLRVLRLSFCHLDDVSAITRMLPSLTQLERFLAHLEFDVDDFTFPPLPRLRTVELWTNTVGNLNMTNLVNLADLDITCQHLVQSSFPDSLIALTLHSVTCSSQLLSSVARLPNLTYLGCPNSILSLPHLCFTSTITTLIMIVHDFGEQGIENLRQMTKLSSLYLTMWDATSADAEVIASLPSLTAFRSDVCTHNGDASMEPFRHMTSLQHLWLDNVRPHFSFHTFAFPSLLSLILLNVRISTSSFHESSLSPLAACINLTALNTDVHLSEQEAQVISGLTKLEKLCVTMKVEACFTHICTLPRLKLLSVRQCIDSRKHKFRIVGLVAASALVGLAPTIEQLSLPYLIELHTHAVVCAVSRLTRLSYFSTDSVLSYDHMLLLRSKLPRFATGEPRGGITWDVGVHIITIPSLADLAIHFPV